MSNNKNSRRHCSYRWKNLELLLWIGSNRSPCSLSGAPLRFLRGDGGASTKGNATGAVAVAREPRRGVVSPFPLWFRDAKGSLPD